MKVRIFAFLFLMAQTVRAGETLTIPGYAYQRASDEVKLMALLHQDVEDAHMAHVDLKLRKEIAHLAAQVGNEY